MVDKLGGLISYWQQIGFSKDLFKNKSIKVKICGTSILLWRDENNQVFAVADVCSHKRSPLEISDFGKNEIVCPYHGWKYKQNGELLEIPSSPHLDLKKLNCNLKTYQIKEQDGIIWINLKENSINETEPFSLKQFQNWSKVKLKYAFNTTEELLIENFMDVTHTPFIHQGIIRGIGEKVKHEVKLNTKADGVFVEFAEVIEEIGFGLSFLMGKNQRIKHTDSFLFPNIVKVDYFINEIHRFNAFVACTAIDEAHTEAFITLSFNFKWLNPVIKFILPFLAKKVLVQDDLITKAQFLNQIKFEEMPDKTIDCDAIHNKVVLLRKSAKNNIPINDSESKISLYL